MFSNSCRRRNKGVFCFKRRNEKAKNKPETAKGPYFWHFIFLFYAKPWRKPWPHIKTDENLHATPKLLRFEPTSNRCLCSQPLCSCHLLFCVAVACAAGGLQARVDRQLLLGASLLVLLKRLSFVCCDSQRAESGTAGSFCSVAVALFSVVSVDALCIKL